MSGNNFGWGHFPNSFGHVPRNSYSNDPYNLNNPSENYQRNSYHTGYQEQDSHGHQSSKSIEPKAEQPCYYEILQVCKTADSNEIKKAYRKQSLLWHPDKNAQNNSEAEEKFKLISEAYQVLSDDKKRREYDSRGLLGPMTDNYSNHQDFHNTFPSGVFTSPSELFNQVFGDFAFDQSHFMNDPFLSRDPFSSDASSMGNVGSSFFTPFGMFGYPGSGFMSPYSHAPNLSPFGFGNSNYSFSSSSSSTFISGGQRVKKTSSVINGRSTTIIETTDSQGNVKREVLYS